MKKKEIITGEFFPAAKSKKRVSYFAFEHTKPINIEDIRKFLEKYGVGDIRSATYKNAVIADK